MPASLSLGLDFGTTGVRACVIANDDDIVDLERIEFGDWHDYEIAGIWREALWDILSRLPRDTRSRLGAVAVDGTSATVLACDAALNPLLPPLPYHDSRARDEAASISRVAGKDNPAAVATSGLAKSLWLRTSLGAGRRADCFLNQADWITGLLSDQVGMSDYHNALKMGFDVERRAWPDWVGQLMDMEALPSVSPPGAALAAFSRPRARSLGIASDCLVKAGTTDSIAAFIAGELGAPGMAVTSLGTTIAVKLLSTTRVESGTYGVYSHWYGALWLAGGASNAGGAILRRDFEEGELACLSGEIDPESPSGLDYYPLVGIGERFPVNDPEMAPRLEPRPLDRVHYLHGILEGLARIEALGYRRLTDLGASPLRAVTTAGGGADNPAWRRIRKIRLGVPVSVSRHQDPAFGAARLARLGTGLFPGGPVDRAQT